MRRWWIVVAVAASGLVLCVSAVAASKTYYTSGRRGKAPYISLTVAGGQVGTVAWWLNDDCGETVHGPTHLNASIKQNGRFNKKVAVQTHDVFDTEYDVHVWGRLNGSTATVRIDEISSGLSQSVCEGQHTFHAVDAALEQGRG
jgi:hypothetical protein